MPLKNWRILPRPNGWDTRHIRDPAAFFAIRLLLPTVSMTASQFGAPAEPDGGGGRPEGLALAAGELRRLLSAFDS
jgi:hypothetical protein